jgi:hypothetical protein
MILRALFSIEFPTFFSLAGIFQAVCRNRKKEQNAVYSIGCKPPGFQSTACYHLSGKSQGLSANFENERNVYIKSSGIKIYWSETGANPGCGLNEINSGTYT